MSNKNKPYLPDERTDYKPKPSSLISRSIEGISTEIPNPVEDPIVVNNIAYPEFDYTESILDDKNL